ncbi:MAG TPA: ribonuclease P protein component [Treponemataceae bacterium]|nr:ribonuclease P protein component [Treponemataceae bacterium]
MHKTGRFTRDERIKRSADIQNLFKKGTCFSTKGAKLFVLKNNLEINRIGFVLPRKYGNAVKRNRSKRYSREAYRFYKAHLKTGYDMLLLIYPGNDTFNKRCEQFTKICKKSDLFQKNIKKNHCCYVK